MAQGSAHAVGEDQCGGGVGAQGLREWINDDSRQGDDAHAGLGFWVVRKTARGR